MITNQIELFFFFFNDTATTEIYTLSLHDALPISPEQLGEFEAIENLRDKHRAGDWALAAWQARPGRCPRAGVAWPGGAGWGPRSHRAASCAPERARGLALRPARGGRGTCGWRWRAGSL